MPKLPPLAITTCRVSSDEQLKGHSLERQAEVVKRAAKELGAIIPPNGQWSMSVSSKAGTNVLRKDLKQMIAYVQKNPRVKYLIVHEVDRFMRSVDELFYFEVTFRQYGVKIWYASQPELNEDDHKTKLFKALEVFKAEGSNVERIEKSIDGLTDALRAGRYPFPPPVGYRKGYKKGIPEIDGKRGEALRLNLLRLHTYKDPAKALVELNDSDFTKGYSKIRMDKYRHIATNIFYAGAVTMNKQVKLTNLNGKHQALITLEQHYEIVRIFDNRRKNQSGPTKEGNPKYPLNNFVSCTQCDSGHNRLVGFDHGNGSGNGIVYEKYRCRNCNKYISRKELHESLSSYLSDVQLDKNALEQLKQQLYFVWKREEKNVKNDVVQLRKKANEIERDIEDTAIGAIDPVNRPIKSVLLAKVERLQNELQETLESAYKLEKETESIREEFIQFAISSIKDLNAIWLSPLYTKRNREECKQLLFPNGFFLNKQNKVYTTEISPLYTLQLKKKDTEVSNNSTMVRVQGL